jgi:hypothetical protein
MARKENINFIFQINNKARSTNFFFLIIVSGILFLGLAFLFIATNMNYELIATTVVAIVYFVLFSKIKPAYFEMLVSEEHLQINFYPLSSMVRHYQSIEMPLFQLKGFTIKSSIMGIKKELILSVESRYGIADYPPVSITILSKTETAQIFHVLNKIVETNTGQKY